MLRFFHRANDREIRSAEILFVNSLWDLKIVLSQLRTVVKAL
jgi:hypothetical protein